ncbi:MAG: RNA 2',3'-cyclic phosphodiesterase [Beijerinckiaceae bacterium]|nr:RNA 2',3'-cyclic phosphodiesterase [Beijerinckiaceae bacterium]
MPRLFTGLETPANVALRLSLLRGGVARAKWIEPDDYHLTLSFIGNVDDSIARHLVEELALVAAPQCFVRLVELRAFGGDRPRSIVAVAELSSELAELQAASDRALRRAGVETERRKFTPHVTLARVKGASVYAIAAYLSERSIRPIEFAAPRFVLYSARTSQGGGPYVVEAAYPLG